MAENLVKLLMSKHISIIMTLCYSLIQQVTQTTIVLSCVSLLFAQLQHSIAMFTQSSK